MWKLSWSKNWKKKTKNCCSFCSSYELLHCCPMCEDITIDLLSALQQPHTALHWLIIALLSKKAWETLCSQQLFSLAVMALHMKTYFVGLISNLTGSNEDCSSLTVSLIVDSGYLPYLWVLQRGGLILQKGLTGIFCNVLLFPFPPFSSFTKC